MYRYADGVRGYKVRCAGVSCIFEFEAYEYCGSLRRPDDPSEDEIVRARPKRSSGLADEAIPLVTGDGEAEGTQGVISYGNGGCDEVSVDLESVDERGGTTLPPDNASSGSSNRYYDPSTSPTPPPDLPSAAGGGGVVGSHMTMPSSVENGFSMARDGGVGVAQPFPLDEISPPLPLASSSLGSSLAPQARGVALPPTLGHAGPLLQNRGIEEGSLSSRGRGSDKNVRWSPSPTPEPDNSLPHARQWTSV